MNLNLVRICSHTSDSYQLPSLPGLCTLRGITDVRDVVQISLHTNKYLQNYIRQKDPRKGSHIKQILLQMTRGEGEGGVDT